MGCFLACFGFKKKKKRKKSAKESPSGEQNIVSYVPLDSDASIKENHFISKSHQQKEKPKKKVSFNLNVKAYEPIPNDDDNGKDSYDELKLDKDDLDFDDIGFEDSDEHIDDVCSNGSDDVITNNIPDERNKSIDKAPDLQRLQGRDRSWYVLSVLNLVENLTQWKQVKAKAAKMHPKCEKENLVLKLEDNSDSLDFKKIRNSNVAVDASLSNWLGSS
ncbi:hypothetical protein CDL12_15857 [Handroanthus impetiginosus]|uniref:Uncharacterized protein n=1 Tax=Handroanthus impetiginosus TaxID=429701 RepID=A0A2G9H1X6_9LAMI|nr:hypothetical protein CDL12_15857 [Handroanthus impetiginosus]